MTENVFSLLLKLSQDLLTTKLFGSTNERVKLLEGT